MKHGPTHKRGTGPMHKPGGKSSRKPKVGNNQTTGVMAGHGKGGKSVKKTSSKGEGHGTRWKGVGGSY